MLGECHISFFILSSLYFSLTLSILGRYSDLGVSANLHISFYPPYDKAGILCLLHKFGLSILLGLLLVLVTLGTILFLKILRSSSKNGNNVTVKSISNKNAESIGYIATYIIPFLFQSFDELGDIIPLLILLIIIYRIYVTSSLLLVNPVLNCKYSLFEMEYEEQGQRKQGLMISPFRDIYESDNIKIYNIGYKLFYVNKINKK